MPDTEPDCQLCGDTGWITYADFEDYAGEIPCPGGCAGPIYTADDVFSGEAPSP